MVSESGPKKKIAIIGASYLQLPLIQKVQELGMEAHVFAWAADDVGEKEADYFYPISIVEKEQILKKCREIKIDGICSIASDLAVGTINYVADRMNLCANSMESTEISTNKAKMREAFWKHEDPSPKFLFVGHETPADDILLSDFSYPVIVKPVDRSGSRGVSLVMNRYELNEAVERARRNGFLKDILVEEFAKGKEFSVECISYKGTHTMLAITEKFTTEAPHYIEVGHLEPADIDTELNNKIKNTVFHALDTLKIQNGASHTEIKILEGQIKIIEIGARMGGDMIGSSLVPLSTGVDFVKAVIDIALGKEPNLKGMSPSKAAGIRFILTDDDIKAYTAIKAKYAASILEENIPEKIEGEVSDSSERFGYYIFQGEKRDDLIPLLP